jgi:hypothetical protein
MNVLTEFENGQVKKQYKSEDLSETTEKNGLHKVVGLSFNNFISNNSIMLFYRQNEKKSKRFILHMKKFAALTYNVGLIDCDSNGGENFPDYPSPNVVLYIKDHDPQPLFGLNDYEDLLFVLKKFDPERMALLNEPIPNYLGFMLTSRIHQTYPKLSSGGKIILKRYEDIINQKSSENNVKKLNQSNPNKNEL